MTTTPNYLTGRTIRGFQLNQLLGAGRYGAVYQATCDGESIAIKASLRLEEARIEAEILQCLVYEKGVAPKYHFEEEEGGLVFIGMELCGQDLYTLLRATENGKFTPKVMQQLAHHTLCALEALHSKKIIHRDLKLNNVCVSVPNAKSEVRVLLIDYGHGWIFQDVKGREVEDRRCLNFGVMLHSSANVASGLEPTTKDDLVQLIYLLMQAAGFDFQSVFRMPPPKIVEWKHLLLRDPSSILTAGLQWLIPFVDEVSQVIEDAPIDYEEMKIAIRDVVYDSCPEAPLKLVEVNGAPRLE